jgi:aminoglycoside phosphotransferase (APT) family kinase protein
MIVDEPRPIRPGEQLDTARLASYLAATLGGDGPLAVAQFPGGHSNLTYQVTWGDRELVLRRPPFGSTVKTAHDMGREFRVLSALAAAATRIPVPRPVALCDDDSVIGAQFYLMERIRGIILRKDPPPGLELTPALARRLCETLVDTLVELHAIDAAAVGLGDFGRPDGFVERQVSGWTERYAAARTDDIADVDHVAAWLRDHRPVSGPPSLLHNDFKFDNLVLDPADPTRVIGILDWEMAARGDPLMDVGTSLSYWVQADDPAPVIEFRFVPTNVPGMMPRAELAALYAERSGRDLSHVVFYYCFGLFKTAVVAQQIYARYARNPTRDERFASMIVGVRMLAAMAAAAIRAGSL